MTHKQRGRFYLIALYGLIQDLRRSLSTHAFLVSEHLAAFSDHQSGR